MAQAERVLSELLEKLADRDEPQVEETGGQFRFIFEDKSVLILATETGPWPEDRGN